MLGVLGVSLGSLYPLEEPEPHGGLLSMDCMAWSGAMWSVCSHFSYSFNAICFVSVVQGFASSSPLCSRILSAGQE